MKLQKRIILWVLLILIALLVGCGKAPENIPPTSTESTSEIETSEADPIGSESNLYLASTLQDSQKKYGYINLSGAFVIEPIYSFGTDFNEGFAVVGDAKGYQVIDQTGKVIFENEGLIEPFHNGLAVFTDQETYKLGYIDTNGQIAIEPRYLMATPFNEEGTAIVSSAADALTVLDKSGQIIKDITLDSEYTGLYDVRDDYALFISSSQDGSKMGVLSLEGQMIIPPDYNSITNLGKGRFAVKDPTREFFDALETPSAIFDSKGNQLTDYIYYNVNPFQGDFASATDSTDTFFIGLDGMIASNLPKLKGIGSLTFTGNLIKADIDGALSYLNEDGTIAWQADQSYKLTDTITIKQNRERLSRTALVIYPSLGGLEDSQIEADINEGLKALFTDSRDIETLEGLSIDDSFEASLNGNLLTIQKSGYDYPSGAAHGMPIQEYYQLNIKTGTFYNLKDLFVDKSDYLTTLNALLVNAIQKSFDDGNTWLSPESFSGLTEDANFIITNEALIIYFYPYDIAAFAAGFQEFSIPYDDLMTIIDVDGELWNSFEH